MSVVSYLVLIGSSFIKQLCGDPSETSETNETSEMCEARKPSENY